MPTVQTVIIAAYRKTGQIITATDTTDLNTGLEELNYMLNSWSAENLSIPSITQENFNLTIGQNSYTVGSSGDFNTVRPNIITSAYIKHNSNDYPVNPMSEQEYNDIVTKATQTRPTKFYFLPSYSLAKIFFNYTPDSAYAFYFDSLKFITNVSTLSQTLSLPPEYEEAIIYNLAIRLASNILLSLSPVIYAIANDSKEKISKLHTQQLQVPKSKFDDALIGNAGIYNIASDEYN